VTEPAAATFEALRPRLHGVAYRMTGSVSDAEDLCQEAWLRWSQVDPATVANPESFLVTTVTRLSIDRLRSAARRREV
jgi:RNA polymerase sigma-70 factor (ECF subfamily)